MSGGGGGDAGEIFGVDRKKAILGIAAAAALSLGVVALFGQATSYQKLLHALENAQRSWLALTLAGELVAYAGYVVAYRDVARTDGGPKLSYWTAARIVGLGLGAYVIGSSAGGLTVDFWAMHEAGAELHEAARRTLALNTLQAAALAAFAFVSGGVVLVAGPPDHVALVMALVWLGVVPACVAGAAILSSPRRARRLTRVEDHDERPSRLDLGAWAHWLARKLRKGFADAIGGVVVVRHVLLHPLRHWQALIGYPLFWLGDFFILYVALRAFGAHLEPQRLVLAEASAWVLSFLPLPAGGSGAAEATMTFALHAVGVPISEALFGALTYRFVNFWLPIVPALALLTQVKKLQQELPESERAPEEQEMPAA